MTKYYHLDDIQPKSPVTFFNIPMKFMIGVMVFAITATPSPLDSFKINENIMNYLAVFNAMTIAAHITGNMSHMMPHFFVTCALAVLSMYLSLEAFFRCILFQDECSSESLHYDSFEPYFRSLLVSFVLLSYQSYLCYSSIIYHSINYHLKDKQVISIDYEGSKDTKVYRVDDLKPEELKTIDGLPTTLMYFILTLLIIFVSPFVFPLSGYELNWSTIFIMGFQHFVAFLYTVINHVPTMMVYFSVVIGGLIIPGHLLLMSSYAFIKSTVLGLSLDWEFELLQVTTEQAEMLNDWVYTEYFIKSVIYSTLYFYYIYLYYSMIKNAIITYHLKDKKVISIE